MVFGGWSLLTHLSLVFQYLINFSPQSVYIFLFYISLVWWDSLDPFAVVILFLVPPALLVVAITTPFDDTLLVWLSYLTIFFSVTPPHTFIVHLP